MRVHKSKPKKLFTIRWRSLSVTHFVSLPISGNIQSQHSKFILSHSVTQTHLCQCPNKHKVRLIQHPHAYMTEVGLGRMQALGPKWVAGYGPCRKWALLWEGKTVESREHHLTSQAAELCGWHEGPAGNLQCKPLRRTFRCVACWTAGLQVLVLAWQPPALDLPQQLFMIAPPSLRPLPIPSFPWWLGRVLPVLRGPGWLWHLTERGGGSQHGSVRHCQGPRWRIGLWIFHPAIKEHKYWVWMISYKISQTWVKFTSDNTGIKWLVLVQ